ncbi:MAG: hypothetical protein JXR76_08195 [Deltaproteobacteria bacterium]|nr:hypothetical protein [Deltaproteobacteria bacterium]
MTKQIGTIKWGIFSLAWMSCTAIVAPYDNIFDSEVSQESDPITTTDDTQSSDIDSESSTTAVGTDSNTETEIDTSTDSGSDIPTDTGTQTDAGTDSETDADTASDTESDSVADTESDSATDTAPECEGCWIAGHCYADGDTDTGTENSCHFCDAESSTDNWTNKAAGATCDDGKFCNGVDSCDTAGVCQAGTLDPCISSAAPCQKCDETKDDCSGHRSSLEVCDTDLEPTAQCIIEGGQNVHVRRTFYQYCNGHSDECAGDTDVDVDTIGCGSSPCIKDPIGPPCQ